MQSATKGDSSINAPTKKRTILYSNEEWSKLLSYLSEKQRSEELVDMRQCEMQDRKERSKKIKDSFVDSKEEQKIRIRLKREKAEYEKELQKIQEEKGQENLKIIEQTKFALRSNKDGWRALDSAFRLADTLRERKKQREFQEHVKTIEKELDKVWSEKILQDAREFQEEKQKEVQEKIIKKTENFLHTRNSLKEMQQERNRLRQQEIQEEQREIDQIKKEIKEIEEKEKADKDKMRRIVNEMTSESFLLEERKNQKEKEEEEFDKATFHIIKQTTGQLTDMKNQIMQGRHAADVARREKIHQHYTSLMRAAKHDEEERIRRALEEEEEKHQAKLKSESEKRRQLAHDKIKSYQQYLRDVEKAEKQEKEKIKWEILKRTKMTEHDRAREKEIKDVERRKKQNQREDLDTQMEELNLYAAEEKKYDQDAVNRSALLWKLDDTEVMKYGDKLLKDCESKERPTLPVVKAITNYKRNKGMVSQPSKNLSQWKSNVLPRPFQNK